MGVGICILITDGDKRLSRLCRIMGQGGSRINPAIPVKNGAITIREPFLPEETRQDPVQGKIL
jgi:hypothetical protein